MNFWLQWALTFLGAAVQAACLIRLALQHIPFPAPFRYLSHFQSRITVTANRYDTPWVWAGLLSCLILGGRAVADSDTTSLVAEALLGVFFVYTARKAQSCCIPPTVSTYKDSGIDKRQDS